MVLLVHEGPAKGGGKPYDSVPSVANCVFAVSNIGGVANCRYAVSNIGKISQLESRPRCMEARVAAQREDRSRAPTRMIAFRASASTSVGSIWCQGQISQSE